MIEVEKKFQPTDEQLKSMLEGADFIKGSINHDIYYDYEDLRLLNNGIRLRNRNGSFEVKIKQKTDNYGNVINSEIEDEEEIKKYLNITGSIQDFIDHNMIVFSDYVNNRKKYKKGIFNIDLDDMDFGYKLCEIEVMVENENQIEQAESEIINFINQYGIELKKIPMKREVYLKLKNPDLYNKIYGSLV